ncbi:GNAT family N-acetyltransferase [Streptomyces sp. TR06-5]|uniref:GNAT family N-acetyltransferase n=1 Tax=unclassified Streptomyces TaxID=2593676 RepID=UPI0039A1446D
METVRLATERLELRPFRSADVDDVAAACQDPEIARWIPIPVPYGREDALEFVERISPGGWREDTMYNFGVFTRDTRSLVGSMGLVRLAELRAPTHQAEIGFWTAKPQRRKGYTEEAARAVIRWAFEDLGVERLEWVATAGNTASRAVAEKLGFVMEGLQRAKIVHRGVRRDAWHGALLPTDWDRSLHTPYLPAR